MLKSSDNCYLDIGKYLKDRLERVKKQIQNYPNDINCFNFRNIKVKDLPQYFKYFAQLKSKYYIVYIAANRPNKSLDNY